MSEIEEKPDREHESIPTLAAVPTGSLRLDLALGAGGISSGQFIEISGTESSGKTTLCQHIVAEAQRMNRLCAWIDTDHSFNPVYAKRCGIALEQMLFTSPPSAEQAFDTLEVLLGAHVGIVAVLDSVDALTPQDELCLPLGFSPSIGTNNKIEEMLSLMLRKLNPVVKKSQAILLFTNRPPQQKSEAYHQLSTHMSRLSLKLHAGLRLKLQENGHILENGLIAGQRVHVKILKNKNIAPPLRVEFDIIYNQGIDHNGEVFDLGLQTGLIHQHAEVFTFQGLVLGIGRNQAIETLERQALLQPLEQVIRQKLLRTSLSGEK